MAGSKRSSRSADRHRRIRQAAFRCFSDRGYDETTVDAICQAAGVSKGSFYWHFKSKQEVFLTILESWAEEVEAQLGRRFRNLGSVPDPLALATRGLAAEARRAHLMMPVWLDSLARVRREPEVRAALADFHRRIRATIANLLRPFLEDRLGRREIDAIAGTLLAAYVGLVGQNLADPAESSFDDQLRLFMPVLGWYLAQAAAPEDED